MSYWSVDSIFYPNKKLSNQGKNALIRMVHYTDDTPPGTRTIAVQSNLLAQVDGIIDFGRVFDFNRRDFREYSTQVEFQGRSINVPYFRSENINFLIQRRRVRFEEDLRGEISNLIKNAGEMAPTREPAPLQLITIPSRVIYYPKFSYLMSGRETLYCWNSRIMNCG